MSWTSPCADEAEAVAVAQHYLSYFTDRRHGLGRARDQRALRHVVPENRVRAYEIREVIDDAVPTSAPCSSCAPAGAPAWSPRWHASRAEPIGIVANNPTHLGGAIDADAADKAARFMQLCDAFDLPILLLCDTPGFMVGPEAEQTALVRHVSRMFVTGANLTVPFFTIIVRKGYGLGAQAMAGGTFKAPLFTRRVADGRGRRHGPRRRRAPGFRRELDAIEDDDERERRLRGDGGGRVRARQGTERGVALRVRRRDRPGRLAALDHHCARGVAARTAPRTGKKRPNIDTW